MSELTLLTDEQRRAVETLDRPVTLVAAAGSGKTTVLVQRYLALLDRGRLPKEILTVTFTNEAADQLRERIRARLIDSGNSPELISAVETTPNIGTLHSFCYALLDHSGSVLGLPPIHRILGPFEMAAHFDSAYQGWLEGLPEASLRRVLGYFTHGDLRQLTRELYDQRYLFRSSLPRLDRSNPAEFPELVLFLSELLEPLFQTLERKFTENGIYSFDELEQLALRILQDSDEVRRKLQTEIKHVLVDEFQDTSQLQWEILKRVLGEQLEKLFIVGDPKQSIYSFRHAEVRLFAQIALLLENHGGATLELATNFRSAPPLLDVINQLGEVIFQTAEVPFTPMRSGQEPREPLRAPLTIHRFDGGSSRGETSRREIVEVVTAVKNLLESGTSPKDIALLFRVSDRIPEYFKKLAARGISVSCKQSTRLLQCYDVVDLVSYLKVVHNPLDDFALASFLKSAYVGATHQELWAALEPPGDSLFEKIFSRSLSSGGAPGTGESALARRLGWLAGLIESGDCRLSFALETLFARGNYWPSQFEAVLEFLSPLTRDVSPDFTVTEAVEKILSWEKETILFQSEQREGSRNAVNLMTVHAAKGLEFAHVFLVDNLRPMPRRTPATRLRPGSPPGLRFRQNGEAVTNQSYETLSERQHQSDIEEARRILYVALTRPRQSLTVFLPKDPKQIPKGTWGEWLDLAFRQSLM